MDMILRVVNQNLLISHIHITTVAFKFVQNKLFTVSLAYGRMSWRLFQLLLAIGYWEPMIKHRTIGLSWYG